jgi:hypothetical protein
LNRVIFSVKPRETRLPSSPSKFIVVILVEPNRWAKEINLRRRM